MIGSANYDLLHQHIQPMIPMDLTSVTNVKVDHLTKTKTFSENKNETKAERLLLGIVTLKVQPVAGLLQWNPIIIHQLVGAFC